MRSPTTTPPYLLYSSFTANYSILPALYTPVLNLIIFKGTYICRIYIIARFSPSGCSYFAALRAKQRPSFWTRILAQNIYTCWTKKRCRCYSSTCVFLFRDILWKCRCALFIRWKRADISYPSCARYKFSVKPNESEVDHKPDWNVFWVDEILFSNVYVGSVFITLRAINIWYIMN